MGSEILDPLGDPQVVEIMLNPDEALWVDRLGAGMERVAIIEPVRALTIVNTVAAMLDAVVTPDRPILECELPLDGSRFEALIPPLV
ncbi:MAG: P-type conjugative transfer ATPase TrbB, partial [Thiomonas sp.]